MIRTPVAILAALVLAAPAFAQDKADPWHMPGEDKVDLDALVAADNASFAAYLGADVGKHHD